MQCTICFFQAFIVSRCELVDNVGQCSGQMFYGLVVARFFDNRGLAHKDSFGGYLLNMVELVVSIFGSENDFSPSMFQ